MNSNRKQFLRAFFLSMALTSGVVTAQMAPAPYQQWPQYPLNYPYFSLSHADLFKNLSLMQEQLYRQLQSYSFPGYLYFGAIPPWGGNFTGSRSHLQDRGDHYLVQMRLPGVTSRDINMRFDGQVLTISVQARGDQANLGRWQIFSGNLQQIFILPEAVDSSRVRGQFQNGLLTIVVPKLVR